MSSAVDKVFAIPELLESILLSIAHTHSNNDELCNGSCSGIAGVFGLQRVNRQYRAVIATSPELQRHLYLEYQDPREDLHFTGLHYLLRHRSSLWTHGHIYNRLLPSQYSPEARHQNGYLVYALMASCSIFAQNGVGAHPAPQGYAEFETVQHQQPSTVASWKQMKLSSRPAPIIFGLRVNVWSGNERILIANYVAIFCFEHGTETLEDLFAALRTISHRSVKDHVAVSQRFEAVRALYRESEEEMKRLREEHKYMADCGRAQGLCHICACDAMRQPPLAYI